MSDQDPVRVGQVGLGWFGQIHAQTWLGVPGTELVGVCDTDPAKLRLDSGPAAQSSFHVSAGSDPLVLPDGVRRHARLDELLDDGIDVLDVVVHESAHAELVRAALLAGVHVIVEKPMALALAEVRELIDLAAERHRHIYVGHILRFDPRNVHLAAMIDRDSLRHMSFHRNFQETAHQVYGRVHPVFGAAIHDIDLALWYAGRRPETVSAFASSYFGAATPDVLDIVLHWGDGLRAVVQNSWHLSASCPYGFEFAGEVQTRGTTYVVRNEPDLHVWDASGVTSPEMHFWPLIHGARAGAIHAELTHFADCVRQGVASDRVPLAQVLWTAEIADAVLRATADAGHGPVAL